MLCLNILLGSPTRADCDEEYIRGLKQKCLQETSDHQSVETKTAVWSLMELVDTACWPPSCNNEDK